MTQAIASADTTRNELLKIAAGGVVSGILTTLAQLLVDKLSVPGDIRIALVALPFAVLVFIMVRRRSANPNWAALLAAIVTMVAFVCAVNAAIFIDGQLNGAGKILRNILAGLTGGFAGAAVMALGIGLLAGPRNATAWLPMLITGAVAGVLLAFDNALDLSLLLYPVWQAGVAVRLALALRK